MGRSEPNDSRWASPPNNFDLIRLFAALQVVVFHSFRHMQVEATGPIEPAVRLYASFPGVPIFFVISGFLISMSWERTRKTRSYGINRVLRIYPALWAAFAVAVILTIATGHVDLDRILSGSFWLWVAAQLSFVQLYNPSFLDGFGVGAFNGVLWTIPVEISFYVLLPMLYRLVLDHLPRRRGDLFLVVLIVISYTILHVSEGRGEFLWRLARISLPGHLWMFLVGVLCQRNLGFVQHFLAGRFVPFLVAYLSFEFFRQQTAASLEDLGYLTFLMSRLLLGAVTLSGAYSARGLAESLLRRTDVSYGVYLYHMLVINLFVELGWFGHFGWVGLVVVSTIALASLSWFALEKPVLGMKPARRRAPPSKGPNAGEEPIR